MHLVLFPASKSYLRLSVEIGTIAVTHSITPFAVVGFKSLPDLDNFAVRKASVEVSLQHYISICLNSLIPILM